MTQPQPLRIRHDKQDRRNTFRSLPASKARRFCCILYSPGGKSRWEVKTTEKHVVGGSRICGGLADVYIYHLSRARIGEQQHVWELIPVGNSDYCSLVDRELVRKLPLGRRNGRSGHHACLTTANYDENDRTAVWV